MVGNGKCCVYFTNKVVDWMFVCYKEFVGGGEVGDLSIIFEASKNISFFVICDA